MGDPWDAAGWSSSVGHHGGRPFQELLEAQSRALLRILLETCGPDYCSWTRDSKAPTRPSSLPWWRGKLSLLLS